MSSLNVSISNRLTVHASFWGDDATFVPLTALMALLMLAGCGSSPETPTAPAPVPTGAVKDTTWFVQQLQARGATVTLLQTVDLTLLFAAPLRLYRVNHERISVYEYANERAAQSETAKISPGGERIGSVIVNW